MREFNNYPIKECMEKADKFVKAGAVVFQKFSCIKCNSRQTMTMPNCFYELGTCEECGHVTDLKKHGCNFMYHISIQ